MTNDSSSSTLWRTKRFPGKSNRLKLLLIAPARLGASARKGKNVHQLNLALLAALATPYFDDIKIVEEDFVDLDLGETADLVGIIMLTSQANRAFELGDHFRKKGVKTICGGSHPSFMPQECLQHFDSVVVHEAENVWPQLMADFMNGGLKPLYHSDETVVYGMERPNGAAGLAA